MHDGFEDSCRSGHCSHGMAASRERGAALMIMMLILVLGAAALIARDFSARAAANARIEASAAALAEAKEALLGYAITYDATNPGRLGALPCPDINTGGGYAEGEMHPSGCLVRYRSVLGRFPWKTVGVNPARNGSGECLWYAVSGTWKAATGALPELLNTDSSGQFRVIGADGSTVMAGTMPGDRPVALIIAPGSVVAGQVRNTTAGTQHCAGNYTAANYLDSDAASGINNANLAALPDAVDDFIGADAGADAVNDQVLFITRAEIENRLMQRADVQMKLKSLTDAVARCLADYGRRNPGGASDRRLPWPAPVDLIEYRTGLGYDDTSIGWLSGRVADIVNDSNAKTGNLTALAISGCNPVAVPQWTPEMLTLWQNWKDHFFYAVAGSFRPDASPPWSCGQCLTVNGAGSWAAVLMFSGVRRPALAQSRDEPPVDPDTRSNIANYLEGRNASNHPNAVGTSDYQSLAANATFNDVLYCIDPALGVSAC